LIGDCVIDSVDSEKTYIVSSCITHVSEGGDWEVNRSSYPRRGFWADFNGRPSNENWWVGERVNEANILEATGLTQNALRSLGI